MDENLSELVKRVIETELGEIVSKELEIRFKPIQTQIDIIQKSNDYISNQIKEDRKDINAITIGQATATKATGVIIENQGLQENALIKAVKTEAEKIPANVDKSIKELFKGKKVIKVKNKGFFDFIRRMR